MDMPNQHRGLEKRIWLIIRDGEIQDVIYTQEDSAKFMAGLGDEIVPYTINI